MNNAEPPRLKGYKTLFSFFLTAVLGATINFVSQIFYRNLFSFQTSVLCGYLTATVLTFMPTKRYAFAAQGSGNTGREAVKFVGIALLALVVQVFVSKYTLEWIANPLFPKVRMFWREKASHLVGMGVSFLANYFGHKLLTFRSTGVYDRIRSRSLREKQEIV